MLGAINAQADAWCQGQAADRPCPEDRTLSVRAAFALEQPHLIGLPDNPFASDEQIAVRVGKTPYVRFDRNDYSVPPTQVQCTLTVVASPTTVRVLAGAQVLATHPRSYDQGAQIEDPAHLAELTARKRAARQHRGQDRLAQAAPSRRDLLIQAATRGDNLGSITAALLRLLERYGAAELEVAIGEALARAVPHPNAVRLALEQRRELRDQPPPLAVALPPDQRVRDLVVQPQRLGDYDQLQTRAEDGHDHSD